MMRFPQLIIWVLLGFIFTGCVEHLFTIRIFDDGRYRVKLESTGDSTDVFDDDFPHPSEWPHSVREDVRNDEPVWIQSSTVILQDTTTLNPPYVVDDSLNQFVDIHPLQGIRVTREDGLMATHYRFLYRLQGRSVFTKYPTYANMVRDESLSADDSLRWLPEVAQYIYTKGLRDYRSRQPAVFSPELTSGRIINHIHQYMQHFTPEELFDKISDGHHAFLREALAPFQSQLGPGFVDTLTKFIEPYDEEFRVTHGLRDDQFVMKIIMPGQLVDTNADSLKGDTLIWRYSLDDFMQDDIHLRAGSMIMKPERLQQLIFLGTAGLLFLLWILWKFRGYWTLNQS